MSNHLDALSRETARLLSLQIDTFKEVLTIQNFLNTNEDEQDGTIGVKKVQEWLAILEREQQKLDSLEMVLAVIGTMKAGKSTAINAIVGMEILPNRETAMTTLPTLIRNKHGQREPILKIETIAPLLELSKDIAEILQLLNDAEISQIELHGTEDGKALISQLIEQNGYKFNTKYQGQAAIFEFLKHLNDIMRLAKHSLIDIEPPYQEYTNVADLPVIEVEFCYLTGLQDNAHGSLAILDTPGPNEFGQSEALRRVFKTQLENASAVLLVVDSTQMNTQADREVRDELSAVKNYLSKDRLSVVVNKFDQVDSMSEDEVKNFVADKLMQGEIESNQVFPVSSKIAYLANVAKRHLSHNEKLPSHQQERWVAAFGRHALGSRWEKKIDDIDEVKACIDDLLTESLFQKPIEMVIEKAHANAAWISLNSAISKLADFNEQFLNTLNLRSGTMSRDIAEIRQIMQNLQNDIASCEEVKNQAHATGKKHLSELAQKMNKVMAEQEQNILNAIQQLLKVGKEKEKELAEQMSKNRYETRLLTIDYWTKLESTSEQKERIKEKVDKFFDKESRKVKFYKKEEASEFIDDITKNITAIFKAADSVLNETASNEILLTAQKISQSIDESIKDTLEKAQHELNDKAVEVNFSLPERIDLAIKTIDTSELFSFDKDKDTEEDKKKRVGGFFGFLNKINKNWGWKNYTENKEFYPVDLAKIEQQLVKQLQQQMQQISNQTETYLSKQFQPRIDNHLNQLVTYLQRYLGVLADSMESSQLEQSEKIELIKQLKKLSKELTQRKDEISLIKVNC